MTSFRFPSSDTEEIYRNGGQVSSSYIATCIRAEGPPPPSPKLPELDKYMCPICRQVARQVHQANCCHKYFCYDCISKVSGQACPHCRKERWQYEKRSQIDTIIKETSVSCHNKGCVWRGQLYSYEYHSTNTCRVQLIQCTECKQKIQRQDYAAHLTNDCPMRNTKCPHCDKIDTCGIITEHIATTCPEAPIKCNNDGCSAVVKRRDMEAHCKDCCLQTIPCKYSKLIDCKELVVREKMEDHMTDCLPSHFKLALKQVECLQEKMMRCDKAKESQILRVPVTFKIDKFAARKEQNDCWQSQAFYTHPFGYKMCFRVFPNGAENCNGHAISVYLHLMSGPFDKNLRWPFLCVFKVAILNQLENDNHLVREIRFINDWRCGERYNQRVTSGETAEIGLGEPRFACHTQLSKFSKCIKNSPIQTEYLKDDCVFVSVREVNVVSVPQSWLLDYTCK